MSPRNQDNKAEAKGKIFTAKAKLIVQEDVKSANSEGVQNKPNRLTERDDIKYDINARQKAESQKQDVTTSEQEQEIITERGGLL